MKPSDDLRVELALLIDPCLDDPEDHLAYDPTGQVYPLDCYGQRTIEVFHLTRRRLKDRRYRTIQRTLTMLASIRHAKTAGARRDLQLALDKMLESDAEFAGIARYVARHPDAFGM